jgi:hypothetical protein
MLNGSAAAADFKGRGLEDELCLSWPLSFWDLEGFFYTVAPPWEGEPEHSHL